MKTRFAVIIGLLCVIGFPLSASAGAELPTMSSGTVEPYLSFMAGAAMPFSENATFQDGTQPTVINNVNYNMSHSWGGNAGIWFPTRNKLAGFDLGIEITGFVWYPDVTCCTDYFNNDPSGLLNANGNANNGTTTEISAVYVGPNFLIRYPMAISENYPNGRWHPYIGIGVGAHQLANSTGGFRGGSLTHVDTKQRDTTIGFQGVGGVKVHLFKYVAAFAEAKYLYAHHNGLSSDRYGNSVGGSLCTNSTVFGCTGGVVANPYSSQIGTILVHAGLSVHFNWEPPDWGREE